MTNPAPLQLQLPRLASGGIIFHLHLANLVTLGIAGIIALVSNGIAGIPGLAVSAIIWAPLAIIGAITIRAVPGPVLVAREASFLLRKARGRTSYRHRPDAADVRELRHEGHLVLPGRLRNVRVLAGLEGAALLHDQGTNTVTVIAEVASPSFLTTSSARQDELVHQFASMHRSYTLRRGIKRFTQIERTFSGSVRAVEEHVREHLRAPAAATGLVESVMTALRDAEQHVREHRQQMAWTFDLGQLRNQIRGAGGGESGLARVMESELTDLAHAVREAGFVSIDWLTPGDVRAVARMHLDPLATPSLQSRQAGGRGDVVPGGEAVMALDEARDFVQVDSGFHRVFWIAQWPQQAVYPGVLEKVIVGSMPDGAPIRHTVAIVETPVPIGRALARIREAKKAWEASERMRQKRGQITSEADKHEWAMLIEQEQKLVGGMGEFEVAAYVCVSATSKSELEQATSAMVTHVSNEGVEWHVLYGQQAEALMMCAVPNGEGLG